jgi:hypothetical protein
MCHFRHSCSVYSFWYEFILMLLCILTLNIYNTDHSIWRSCDRASWSVPIIEPTRCTNFSNIFLEWNSTCFGQFLCPSSGVFHWTTASCLQNCVTYTIAVCTVKKLLMMDRGTVRNFVEFYSKNRFEKVVHLVGFITGTDHSLLHIVWRQLDRISSVAQECVLPVLSLERHPSSPTPGILLTRQTTMLQSLCDHGSLCTSFE